MQIKLSSCEKVYSDYRINLSKLPDDIIEIDIDVDTPKLIISFYGGNDEDYFLTKSFTLTADSDKYYEYIQINDIYHIETFNLNCECIYIKDGSLRVRDTNQVNTAITYSSCYGNIPNILALNKHKLLKRGIIKYCNYYYFLKTDTLIVYAMGKFNIVKDGKDVVIKEIKNHLGTLIGGLI